MLTGEPPFTGPTAQAIVAKVMTEEPRPLSCPAPHGAPARRGRGAHRAREASGRPVRDGGRVRARRSRVDRNPLNDAPLHPRTGAAGGPAAARPARGRACAGCHLRRGGLGLSVGGGAGAVEAGPTSYDAVVPDTAQITFAASTLNVSYGSAMRNISVSTAGDFVVFAARHENGDSTALWYRSLQTADTHPIAGTTGATAPRVAPDGKSVAFMLGDQVMVIPIGGGSAHKLFEGKQALLAPVERCGPVARL